MEYYSSLLADYPDLVGIATMPMIIAILAIALPLLIQTIGRIDDKFNSTKLIVVFKKESIFISFWMILIVSILSYIFWILQLPRLFDLGVLNQLIDNSALISIVASTVLLVFITLQLFNLILTYYQTEKLLSRLTGKYAQPVKKKSHYHVPEIFHLIEESLHKIKSIYSDIQLWIKKRRGKREKLNKQRLYFEAISSLLFFSIQKADEPLSRKLLQFYFDAFYSFRQGKKGKIIEYPSEYYDAIFEANGLLCMRKRRPISDFNDSTLFALFIDEYQETKFSPTTYVFLWKLIIQSLYYKREDFIFSYWKKAHQLFNLFLKPADKVFNKNWEVINQAEIDEKYREREEFLEFHYAIGGYLMYLGKYKLVEKIINWTNQTPPKYVLVPETMKEVIERYMQISLKGEYLNPVYFEQKYPFPEITGVDADGIIQMWIKRYISILFLRQYTLHSYYTFSKPLEMPAPPKDLAEKKRWDYELDGLKMFIYEYLTNHKMLNQLNLSKLGDSNWFIDNNKETPESLIDKLKFEISETFEKTKNEQKIDTDKEKEFQDKTLKIINSVFVEYSELFQPDVIKKDFKSFYIFGRYQILDKAGFVADQEVSYLNSDSIVAESVAIELRNLMLNGFVFMNKITYKLSDKDIFYAIDRLEINANDFVIVAIGLNLVYYKRLGIEELIETDDIWCYNGIKVININNSMNTLVSQSLFIIMKNDLPNVLQNEIAPEIKEKYKLDEIDVEKHIYGKILDLNDVDNKIIRDEVSQKVEDKDLSQKVVVCVDLRTEIRYKTNTKCIQFKSFSQFEDRGIINKLSDIKRFE